jgi:hypothetical protein
MKRRYLPFETCETLAQLPSMADAVWAVRKKPKQTFKIGYYYHKGRKAIAQAFKHHGIPLPDRWHINDNTLPRAERMPAHAPYTAPETEIEDAMRTATANCNYRRL